MVGSFRLFAPLKHYAAVLFALLLFCSGLDLTISYLNEPVPPEASLENSLKIEVEQVLAKTGSHCLEFEVTPVLVSPGGDVRRQIRVSIAAPASESLEPIFQELTQRLSIFPELGDQLILGKVVQDT